MGPVDLAATDYIKDYIELLISQFGKQGRD